jgi:hypothetical protein
MHVRIDEQHRVLDAQRRLCVKGPRRSHPAPLGAIALLDLDDLSGVAGEVVEFTLESFGPVSFVRRGVHQQPPRTFLVEYRTGQSRESVPRHLILTALGWRLIRSAAGCRLVLVST